MTGLFLLIFGFNQFIEPYGEAGWKIKGLNEHSIAVYSQKEKIDFLTQDKIEVDAVVIGSSRSARIHVKSLTQWTPYRWINFSSGSSASSEHYHYFKYFDETLNIEKFLYGLDYANLMGETPYRGDIRFHETSSIEWLDYLTLETLEKSIMKISHNRGEVKAFNVLDNLMGWKDGHPSEEEVRDGLNHVMPRKIKTVNLREAEYFKKIQDEFGDKTIFFLSMEHPYIMLLKRKQNYLNLVSMILEDVPHVYIMNPNYMDELMDYKNYKDWNHTNSNLGERMVESIFQEDGEFMVKATRENYQSILDRTYDFICRQDWSDYRFGQSADC